MLVSIVTPSYNQGAFLEQTMQSVLSQDYPDIEYIVVDGGSMDNSPAILEKYADRLTWWISEPDQGQADAIRKGFEKANGDIIGWLNSDDLLAPGAVREAVAAFQNQPGIDLVYGNAVSIDAAGQPLNDMIFESWKAADLAAFNIICQPAVFMRRSAYLAVGGLDPSYHFLLDHHLWLRIASAGAMAHKRRLWAFARQHAEAKNVSQAEKFGQEAHRIANWLLQSPDFDRIVLGRERQIKAAALRFDARYLLDGGLTGRAFRQYLAALRLHPRTALVEWHRILFAALSLVGLHKLGDIFYRIKRRRSPKSLASIQNVAELY